MDRQSSLMAHKAYMVTRASVRSSLRQVLGEELTAQRNFQRELNQFHFDESQNILLSKQSVGVLFRKAGLHVFCLGFIVFMEVVIKQLFLQVHCKQMEYKFKE